MIAYGQRSPVAICCRDEESDRPHLSNGRVIDTATFKDSKFHGLVEFYNEVGQLQAKGTFTMNERCGEWFEGGKTVTYPPCPPPT